MFDKDKDGSITSQELRTVLNALRLDTTDQETMDMISSIDIDGLLTNKYNIKQIKINYNIFYFLN